jgi:hypothetical protein
MSETVQTPYGGFTREELEAAFALVRHPENWKLPIDATLQEDPSLLRIDAIRAAVPFFTGSVASVTQAKGGKVRVRARGYYAAVGA